jgi:hypothetical protein
MNLQAFLTQETFEQALLQVLPHKRRDLPGVDGLPGQRGHCVVPA